MLALVLVLAAQPDLPDFSRAGYRQGEAPPRRTVTHDVRDFGAKPDDGVDDTEALLAAIAAAGAEGGVVGLPPGRFVVQGVLEFRRDGVVLQGAGAGRTVLECPKPLAEIVGAGRQWSWSGGIVQVRGPGGRDELGRVGGGGRELVLEDGYDGPMPEPGEWLRLAWFNDTGEDTLLDALYGGVVPRAAMGEELRTSQAARVREWVHVVEVAGRRITVEAPLRLELRPEWRPTLYRGVPVREVGVEGLTFEFPGTPYPGHLQELGYNAIHVADAVDCWVRDVETRDADSGIFVGDCRRVTVDGFVARGRRMHHVLAVSWGVDNLFTDWRVEAPHVHGTTISWAAHGNVFANGYGKDLAMDAHRAASFENLHTAITIEWTAKVGNPFRSGGSAPRGPHAARRNVYWNVEHRFPDGEGKVVFGPVREWPLAVFAGWHGERAIEFRPADGWQQTILSAGEEPEIADLYRHQRRSSGR